MRGVFVVDIMLRVRVTRRPRRPSTSPGIWRSHDHEPQWLRATIMAFDGNGNRSGVADSTSYYVLHSKVGPVKDLSKVPVSPFQS